MLDKDTPKTEDFFHESTLQPPTALSQPQPNAAPHTFSASMSPPQGLVRPSAPRDVSPGITHHYNSPSPAERKDVNARDSSDLITDFDAIVEPIIVVEVCQSIHFHTSISHKDEATYC